MTRDKFMRQLRRGLVGMPAESIATITSDYESYFADGLQAGRSETSLTLALGDPRRIAAELRLDATARQWEAARTVRSGVRTVVAALSLLTVDVLSLLPVGLAVLLCALGLFGAFVVLLAGGFVLVVGPWDNPPGGTAAAILQGLGLIAGAISAAALILLVSLRLIDALAWYGQVHRRVFRPLLPRTIAAAGEDS